MRSGFSGADAARAARSAPVAHDESHRGALGFVGGGDQDVAGFLGLTHLHERGGEAERALLEEHLWQLLRRAWWARARDGIVAPLPRARR